MAEPTLFRCVRALAHSTAGCLLTTARPTPRSCIIACVLHGWVLSQAAAPTARLCLAFQLYLLRTRLRLYHRWLRQQAPSHFTLALPSRSLTPAVYLLLSLYASLFLHLLLT